MEKTANRLKCRYCNWQTLRFPGKKRGEGQLRLHVIEHHLKEYQQAMGLVEMDKDTPWTMDRDIRGEQAL